MLHAFYALITTINNVFSTFVSAPWIIFTWPVRQLIGLSAPARVATLVAVFLLVFVATVAGLFLVNPNLVPWRSSVTWERLLIIGVLMLIIPVVVYHTLRVWLEGNPSQYPDIDQAWKAGLAELERTGIRLDQTPLYLILGSPSDTLDKTLLHAARVSLRVDGTPKGPAALHWYANQDAIYLFCTETSCLSKLATMAEQDNKDDEGPPAPAAMRGGGNIRDTAAEGPGTGTQSLDPRMSMEMGGGGIRGTVMPSFQSPTGTMMVDGGEIAKKQQKARVLPKEDVILQQRRLEYLCGLLRRARNPLAAINGVLALLPFQIIQAGPREGTSVQECARTDLAAIVNLLQVRCPVIALVAGMESESGFRELIRRIGRKSAAQQRFGKGFPTWAVPTAEQLESLTAHACGAFEDWVYSLFREKGSLRQSGNEKLYLLLCKMRRNVQNRLANVLSGGFGLPPTAESDRKALLFSGCYFVAAGEEEAQQAFVKGVFDRMHEQQEELEWMPEALKTEASYKAYARLGIAFNVLLVMSLVALIAWNFVRTSS